jgi:hypothetical protein
MKAIPSWFKTIPPSGSEPEKIERQKFKLPTKVNYVDDYSPTVPELIILQESPIEIEMSFGFDPYDKAEISKK